MNFIDFARQYGLVIDHVIEGRWVRVPTEDKPRKRNGAYKYLGDHGHVQNHGTMTETATWLPDAGEARPVDTNAIRRASEEMKRRAAVNAERARLRAVEMLSKSIRTTHHYLAKKGFPEVEGMVWRCADLGPAATTHEGPWPTDNGDVLIVPMFRGQRLITAQLIGLNGEKKFLYGGQTSGCMFVIGNMRSRTHIFCEGYATGLSIDRALAKSRLDACVFVCFSDRGMMQSYTSHKEGCGSTWRGIIVADNDKVGDLQLAQAKERQARGDELSTIDEMILDGVGAGERAARLVGAPYWMSDSLGEDFNDFEARNGLFRSSQVIRTITMLRDNERIVGAELVR